MTSDVVRADGDWLELREPADAVARAGDLVEKLRETLPTGRRLRVHDLGSGTGAMARWLAPRLPGPQRWVLHDRDAELLGRVASYPVPVSADGAPVTVQTRLDDITRLAPELLRDADLLTASALLDMMDASELDRFVGGCTQARCPVLVTLSVVGRVELAPQHELDRELVDAFNAHQRRTTRERRPLGPEAAAVAVAALTEHGFDVTVRPSPWRLGPRESALAAAWLTGWVHAALEQRPSLRPSVVPYLRQRLAEIAAASLSVTVHHEDLLALPRPSVRRRGQ